MQAGRPSTAHLSGPHLRSATASDEPQSGFIEGDVHYLPSRLNNYLLSVCLVFSGEWDVSRNAMQPVVNKKVAGQ